MQRRRIFGLALITLILFALVGARLVWLQGIEWRRYHLIAESVRKTIRFTPAKRGRLLDRFGQVLAHDVPAHEIVYTLREVEFSHLVTRRLERILAGRGRSFPYGFEELQDSLWELRLRYGPGLDRDQTIAPHRWISDLDRDTADRVQASISSRPEHYPGLRVVFEGEKAHVDVDPRALFAGEVSVRRVARRLGLDFPSLFKRLERQYKRALTPESRTQREYEFATREHVLARDVPFDLVVDFAYFPERFQGLRLRETNVRRYPGGEEVAQLVGYVGDRAQRRESGHDPALDEMVRLDDIRTFRAIRSQAWLRDDQVGLTGLERTLESRLRGIAGARIVEVDRRGREYGPALDEEPPIPGEDIALTLDLDLSRRVLAVLRARNAVAGSVLIADPRTGEILVSCSFPTFHPERLGSDWERLQAMAQLAPFWNRPFRSALPPGSTFKTVVALGALEERLVDPARTLTCRRYYDPGHPDRFGCKNHPEDPDVNLRSALARSCNIYFYHLGGEVLKLEGIRRWATRFGFGQLTGIEVEAGSEVQGQLPTRSPESAAIGQGFTATPLQLVRFCSGIANRGAFPAPRLFTQTAPAWTRIELRPEVWEEVRQGMKEASQYGSGHQLAAFDCAVKTGTAQVSASRDDSDDEDIAWIVGFTPTEHPQLVFVVELEHSPIGGGEAAGPVVADVLTWLEEERRLNFR